MNASTIDTTIRSHLATQQAQSIHAAQQSPNLKNLAAFHEMLIREQFVVPDFHSKFVNRETLLAMYHGTIFSIKTDQLIVRNCARPPSKLVLATKMEKYLSVLNKKSGINFEK